MTPSETPAPSAAADPPAEPHVEKLGTSFDWGVQVDAGDAHTLADFWIAALGYELEDNTERIKAILAQGYATESDTYLRPDGVLSWAGFEAIRGAGPRILFHSVPEPKTVKNRWHLDITVGKDAMHAQAERLIALGAQQLRETDEPAGHYIVMQDPEGNEFCLQ